jgi:hypothetical protein
MAAEEAGGDLRAADGPAALTDDDGAEDLRRTVEFNNCSIDCAYFIDGYLTLEEPQEEGVGGGLIPFKLWPVQVDVVWTLMTSKFLIILKARQLGISWLCCGYALWKCLFNAGQTVLLFSRGQDDADELLRRVRVLYERMPEWLRVACPLAKVPNMSEMAWANGSRVKSFPATPNAGSGWTASLAIIDEAAKIPFADEIYTAIKPTIDRKGQLIVLSSAKGVGNLFHRLWTKAVAGVSGFRTVFLPWWERPDRDRAWYDARVAEATDPNQVKQEYPENSQECFLASGRLRFDPAWVDAQAANLRDPLPRESLPDRLRDVPGLAVYQLPVPGRTYVVGADVAEGLEHGDYSDASVLDSVTWEEVAAIHGRWEPDEYAKHLMAMGNAYSAPVAVERNNHGHAVLATMKLAGFTRVALGHDGRPGWNTNVQTKPQMIDLLATALRDGLIVVRTAAALDELKVYRIKPDGSTGAPPSFNDDRVMSRAIALISIRFLPAPRRLTPGPNPLAGYRG